MMNEVSDVRVIRRGFQAMHSVVLNAMDSLSGISNPVASATVQDLSDVANSLLALQNSVLAYLNTRQRQLPGPSGGAPPPLTGAG